MDQWTTLAWNTVEHYLAHNSESWDWGAKSFFEASETYAHLGKTTQRVFSSGKQPKPLWYATRFGTEEENSFSLECLHPTGPETEEQIAEEFEGSGPLPHNSGRR